MGPKSHISCGHGKYVPTHRTASQSDRNEAGRNHLGCAAAREPQQQKTDGSENQ